MMLLSYHPQATSKANIVALIFRSLSSCPFWMMGTFLGFHLRTSLVLSCFCLRWHSLLTCFLFSRMDADHHQVPVRAAAENCGVL